MKAMLGGFLAMILISVGAWLVLDNMGFSTQDRASGAAVRVN